MAGLVILQQVRRSQDVCLCRLEAPLETLALPSLLEAYLRRLLDRIVFVAAVASWWGFDVDKAEEVVLAGAGPLRRLGLSALDYLILQGTLERFRRHQGMYDRSFVRGLCNRPRPLDLMVDEGVSTLEIIGEHLDCKCLDDRLWSGRTQIRRCRRHFVYDKCSFCGSAVRSDFQWRGAYDEHRYFRVVGDGYEDEDPASSYLSCCLYRIANGIITRALVEGIKNTTF